MPVSSAVECSIAGEIAEVVICVNPGCWGFVYKIGRLGLSREIAGLGRVVLESCERLRRLMEATVGENMICRRRSHCFTGTKNRP